VKGSESVVPGILNKTIRAIEICKELNIDFDFIVRTNISTVVNFPALQQLLIRDRHNNRIQYAGQKKVIDWLDPPSGLVDETFFNIPFVTGICIILSRNIVNLLLDSKDSINYSLIDDVAIGEFMYKKGIPIFNLSNMVLENAPTFIKSKWIYRNKLGNREDDLKRMRFIANNISRSLFLQNMV
jgi:hypothetical protein